MQYGCTKLGYVRAWASWRPLLYLQRHSSTVVAWPVKTPSILFGPEVSHQSLTP